MDANKYNREKIISDLAEIKSPHQKIEFLSKLKIDFLDSTDQRDRFVDALNQMSKGGGLLAITHFDKWCDNKINDQIEILKTKNSNMASKESELSAFEIALKHWYLVKYKKEDWIDPVKVGEKYKHLRNNKNIEDHFRDIDSKRSRKPKQKELKNLENSLTGYPDGQKAIQNDIDKLN